MKRKKNDEIGWLKEVAQQALDSLGIVVDERWVIEEVRRAYTSFGYYGEDHPEEVISRSTSFSSLKDAQNEVKFYEAEEGCYLRIKHEKCYEKSVRTWR